MLDLIKYIVEQFAEDKPNGYGALKVFWLKQRRKKQA